MVYKYLFGPVPSRRLGISLGVDLVPHKTCSMDCVYCECGKTTNLTIERKEYISEKEIITELKDYLKNSPDLDYITFSGSGEPTLNSKIGSIVKHIKNNFKNYRIALLTNSTLLYDKNLQKELLDIDLIIPSLDSCFNDTLKEINKPHPEINADIIINGIINFKNQYNGKLWIEVFIIRDINDSEKEIKKLKEVLEIIKPEKIQLNTMDRPGTQSWVKKLDHQELILIKDILDPLPVEIISKFHSSTRTVFEMENVRDKIMSLIKRRPCTLDDLNNISGLNTHELNKNIKYLLENNKIKIKKEKRGDFFIPG